MVAILSRSKAILTAVALGLALVVSGCGGDTCLTTTKTSASSSALLTTCGSPTSPVISGRSISGKVSGAVLSGVLFTLTGAATAQVNGDASGNYSFTGLADGNYTVTPSRAGYVFSPASRAVTVSGGDVSGSDFADTAFAAPVSNLSGAVIGAAVQNVLVTLSGAGTGTTFTDSGGNFSFTGLAPGVYTVAPSLAGYVFSPASSAVTMVSGANTSAGSFAEAVATTSLSGVVSGAVAQDVLVTLAGANTGSAATDANGNFSFANLADGNYTLTPSLTGYIFNPVRSAVAIVGGQVITGFQYVGTAYNAPTSSLSGTVSGAVLQNVTITLSGANTGSTYTDASGNYGFSGLAPGTYTVTPSYPGYTFVPARNTVATSSGGKVTVGNFAALP